MGQKTLIFLLYGQDKNSQTASSILSSKVKLGGDASTAVGPVRRTASAETNVAMKAEILTYSRARGAFAGVSLAGSALRPDNDANKHLYRKEIPAKDIVIGGARAQRRGTDRDAG